MRNHKTGLSPFDKEKIVEKEGMKLKTVLNALTLLREKGWIRDETVRGRTYIRALMGDFSPVDKKHAQPSLYRESEVEKIPDSGNEIPDTGNEIPDLGNGVYIERARGSTSPLTSPETSTHTSRGGRAAGRAGSAFGAYGCVVGQA
jgi:hypothetical protein